MPTAVGCAARLEITALPGVPIVEPGDDLAVLAGDALERASIRLADGDVLVVASKVVSRAEGCFVDLATVEPSPRAIDLGHTVGKDPRIVELILRDALEVSRTAPGVVVVRHRLGFVGANASIDFSNAQPRNASKTSGPWALVLPKSPDASADRLRRALGDRFSAAQIGVVISDSLGRPFRLGTVGAAIGLSGIPALWDRRGEADLFGRVLEHTITALGDQVAAAADLVAGQAAERRAFVHVRGLSFPIGEHRAEELCRAPAQDLYA